MVESKKNAEDSADTGLLPGEVVSTVAPAPTPRTLRLRKFVPYQIYRFARVNMRMINMIRRSH